MQVSSLPTWNWACLFCFSRQSLWPREATVLKFLMTYEDEPLEALERTGKEALQERLVHPLVQDDSGRTNDSCVCDAECDKLHVSRRPRNVRVSLTRMNRGCFVVFLFCMHWPREYAWKTETDLTNWSQRLWLLLRQYRKNVNLVSYPGRNVSAKKIPTNPFCKFRVSTNGRNY